MFNAIANPTSEFVRTKPIEAEDIKRVLPEVKDKINQDVRYKSIKKLQIRPPKVWYTTFFLGLLNLGA